VAPVAEMKLQTPPQAVSTGQESEGAAPVAMTREQRLFELEQRFDADQPADSRAYVIGREVRTELDRALGASGEVRSVDCKLKTCRVALELPSMDADKALFHKILAASEGPFGSFEMRAEREIAPDGRVNTLLFFYM
jgi:hypothetical protein